MVKLYAVADGKARLRVDERLHQWYNISEMMVPSSLKLTIVAVI